MAVCFVKANYILKLYWHREGLPPEKSWLMRKPLVQEWEQSAEEPQTYAHNLSVEHGGTRLTSQMLSFIKHQYCKKLDFMNSWVSFPILVFHATLLKTNCFQASCSYYLLLKPGLHIETFFKIDVFSLCLESSQNRIWQNIFVHTTRTLKQVHLTTGRRETLCQIPEKNILSMFTKFVCLRRLKHVLNMLKQSNNGHA